jgi:signal transduction histidine kinase
VRISADVGLIHRMISNLFDNEVTHLPTGCRVTVNLHREESATLIVQDDGPGFAPEIIPHLFERNTKGHESRGHGLGLAFVDAVARAHGGTVIASNRTAGGARITITLPLHPGISGYSRRRHIIDQVQLSNE